MAACSVFVACVLRFTNYAKTVPKHTLTQLKNNQKNSRFLLHPPASSVLHRNLSGSEYPPNFYENLKYEKVKGKSKTGVEVSTDEWKYVEMLIPPLEPPPPPKHESYPTPAGWAPPNGPSPNTPYHVRRTKLHNIPVYRVAEFGGTRQLTVVCKVDGDIWALATELKGHIQSGNVDMEVPYQVNEYTRKIWFKGIFLDEVRDYIQNKGF